MRVIAGKYKGHKLQYPKNIRPITQKNKKIILDTLSHDLPGTQAVDLYAGSGQIGIELLSNGANHITLVENETRNIAVISQNMEKIRANQSEYQIVNNQTDRFIDSADQSFDIIIADPPHFAVSWSDLANIDKISHPGTILVIKYDQHHPPPNLPGFQLVKTKGAQDNLISFYLYQS